MAIREDVSKFQMQVTSQNFENQFLQDDRKPKKSSRYTIILFCTFDCRYNKKVKVLWYCVIVVIVLVRVVLCVSIAI